MQQDVLHGMWYVVTDTESQISTTGKAKKMSDRPLTTTYNSELYTALNCLQLRCCCCCFDASCRHIMAQSFDASESVARLHPFKQRPNLK